MSENGGRDVRQAVTDAVRDEVRALIAGARQAALAVLSPDSAAPQISRVGVATMEDGVPLVFVSALSAHTGALLADPRCALLIGETGKGDPLAQPRISIDANAEIVGGANIAAARTRYLAAHPKAKLYIDLPDFRFFRLVPHKASYVAGFGRAYLLNQDDLLSTGKS